MATGDVPGYDPKNKDKLAMGCWAEHSDGSLIFIQSVETGRVIFEMFDPTLKDQMFQHAMPEKEFKEQFSWKSGKAVAKQKWTWHDKTPFPWDRVIKSGAKPGMRYVDAETQLSAALKVAKALDLKAKGVDVEDLSTRQAKEVLGIFAKFKKALDGVELENV